MSDTPPTDAPGEDCPDHGPYADDDCPKCDFCGKIEHRGACPELLAYTDRVKAKIYLRLDNPRPCPNCGDLTPASLCASCQEWEAVNLASFFSLDPDYATYGWV